MLLVSAATFAGCELLEDGVTGVSAQTAAAVRGGECFKNETCLMSNCTKLCQKDDNGDSTGCKKDAVVAQTKKKDKGSTRELTQCIDEPDCKYNVLRTAECAKSTTEVEAIAP